MFKTKNLSLGSVWGTVIKYASGQPLIALVFFSIFLSAAIFYGLYSLFLAPAYAANSDHLQKILIKDDENKKGQDIENSEKEFRAEFKKVALMYVQSQPVLPNETEMANVLAQVQEAAYVNNVTLSGLSAAKEAGEYSKAKKILEREMPSIAIGSYDNVVRFLYAVSGMPRILQIKDFAVTSQKEKVIVNFTLFAYNAPPPSSAPRLPEDIQRYLDQELNKLQAGASQTALGQSKPQVARNDGNRGGK